MGLFANLIARFKAPPSGPQRRRFNAAQFSRLTNGWASVSSSANSEIRADLEALRARSRDLANNNDYAKKFLQMLETNVVGPDGFIFRSLAAKPDRSPDLADRNTLEAAQQAWAEAGQCDTTGLYSFADLQRVIIRAIGRDGEALVRRVRDRRYPFGYKQQLLDIDRLDTKYSDNLANGNLVIMGIEYDGVGAPVAYHILTRHPGDNLRGGSVANSRERVPAGDILHLFRPDRPEQGRGVPWMHTAMNRLHMLGAYEEAALVAARTGAAKMGFFTAPDGDGAPLADDQNDQGEFLTDADPGTFGILPKGYEFTPFNPDYPQANYDVFVKACLRGIASGLGVAYNTLANDLEGVNFSSIRSGTLEERDNWMVIQKWFIGAYLIPTFYDWLESALLAGAITMPNGTPLPAAKLAKFKAHTWQGRRWSWVDPLKDIEASLTAIRNGLNSPQQVAAQMGLDLDDVMEALANANARAQALGLPVYCAEAPAPQPPAPADTPEVIAAKMSADALVRSAEINRDAVRHTPAPVFNMAAPIVNVTTPEARNEITVQPAAPAAVEVRNEINVEPTPVNVAAPEVRVDVAAPEVTVEVEATMPAPEVRVALPARKTDTVIERDTNGNIVRATQLEEDA